MKPFRYVILIFLWVILANIEDFAAFNEIYTQYFTQKPARTTFAAKDLAANGQIEIDVIAVK